jgi:hypothetical protein
MEASREAIPREPQHHRAEYQRGRGHAETRHAQCRGRPHLPAAQDRLGDGVDDFIVDRRLDEVVH